MRTLTILALICACTGSANASLGPFAISDPSDPSNTLSLVDGDRVLLDSMMATVQPSGNVLWGPFRTNDFTGDDANANLSIDISSGGNLLSMQKVTVQYLAVTGSIRFLDLTNRFNGVDFNPDMEIEITNVIVPSSITGTSIPDEFMVDPSASVFVYIQDSVAQFRIAAIPEPSAFMLGLIVLKALLIPIRQHKHR